MKVKLSGFITFLLVPAFAEALYSEKLSVNLPGFPLTLGRLLFVICGIIMLFHDRARIIKNKIFIGLSLMFAGQLFASLFFGDLDAITKSIAFILLLVSSYGLVKFWESKWGHRSIDLFFFFLFTFWSFMLLTKFWLFKDLAYSDLFVEGEAVNHHVPGMLVSVSASFLAVRFFYNENGLKMIGYLVLSISLLSCLYIESRSNFLVSMFVLIYLSLRIPSSIFKRIITIIPVMIILFISFSSIINRHEILQKRFTLQDMEYQERTSGMRIAFFKEGVKQFIDNPMGKGIIETRVFYKGRDLMIHNQYLTFLVGGGLIALMGIVFFFLGLINLFRQIAKNQTFLTDKDYQFEYALFMSCIAFFVTLFTIEMSGLFFFFMISFVLLLVNRKSLEHGKSEYPVV